MLDNPRRIYEINPGSPSKDGPVVYWMSRDQRAHENWALLHAISIAKNYDRQFYVLFCLVDAFLGATYRHFDFMLRGLQEVESRLYDQGIPFFMLNGNPTDQVPMFIKYFDASLLVTDFDPLRIKRLWLENVASAINIPLHQVDATTSSLAELPIPNAPLVPMLFENRS